MKPKSKRLLLWTLDRLDEPSTWRGIAALIGLIGLRISLDPDQVSGLVFLAGFLYAAIESAAPEPQRRIHSRTIARARERTEDG